MALDAIPTYPSEYDPTGTTNNPPGSDSRRQGDDQLRILKANLQQALPNVAGPVTATHQELNTLAGVSVTDPIITLPSGTIMLFEAPASAPTGWVRKTDPAYSDIALRVSTGAITQGGIYPFSVLFDDLGEGATPGIGGHGLTGSENGPHTHSYGDYNANGNQGTGGTSVAGTFTTGTTGSSGSGSLHYHGFNNRLKYRDVYFAEKS